jgi:hypothetical protein
MKQPLSAAIIVLIIGALAPVAFAQDLVLDTARREIQVLYVVRGTAPEAHVRLFREADGRETLVGQQTIRSVVGTRQELRFPVSATTNCLYRVEVVEGEQRAIEALNLYDPSARTLAKRRQVSSLLAIPIELIGSFLDKYTSALMSPGAVRIWRIDVASSAVERIADAEGARVLELAVAPDGTVAFAATTPRNPSGELFVARVGAQPTKLSAGSSPVWSDDGERIFFVHEGRVVAVRVSSGALEPIGAVAKPVFDSLLGFPAGGRGRLLAASKLGSELLSFWLINVTTGAVEPVSYDVAYLWLRGLSPDRRSLVHSEYVGAGARSRLMLRKLPEESRRLTDGAWDDTSPAWSPDGKSIYFVSDRPDRP